MDLVGEESSRQDKKNRNKLNLAWWQTFRQTTFSLIFKVVYINPQNSFCGLPKIQFMRRQSRVPAEKNWFLFFYCFCFVDIILFGFSGRGCCLPWRPIRRQVLRSDIRRARTCTSAHEETLFWVSSHVRKIIKNTFAMMITWNWVYLFRPSGMERTVSL